MGDWLIAASMASMSPVVKSSFVALFAGTLVASEELANIELERGRKIRKNGRGHEKRSIANWSRRSSIRSSRKLSQVSEPVTRRIKAKARLSDPKLLCDGLERCCFPFARQAGVFFEEIEQRLQKFSIRLEAGLTLADPRRQATSWITAEEVCLAFFFVPEDEEDSRGDGHRHFAQKPCRSIP